ncbi:hypothetical protein LMG27174_07220 [Paraburkholderia rhynchosiae]|uniref:Uncharacterized protein n=1 Tax=Paraburkholderia rhynchosiae TaxID=487049 RepID=A0A6J5CU07_9BURK|nr:hypothetical protein LMG27174_07220 [Paraburkholderia rhynchosiae]
MVDCPRFVAPCRMTVSWPNWKWLVRSMLAAVNRGSSPKLRPGRRPLPKLSGPSNGRSRLSAKDCFFNWAVMSRVDLRWFGFGNVVCAGHASFRSRLINHGTLHALVGQAWRASLLGALGAQQSVAASSRPSSTLRTLPVGSMLVSGLHHAVASIEPQRKSDPSIHILCRMTASLRATATTARRCPRLFSSRLPHALSVHQEALRETSAWAAV